MGRWDLQRTGSNMYSGSTAIYSGLGGCLGVKSDCSVVDK